MRRNFTKIRWARLIVGACVAITLSGCASSMDGIGYYWQSISGHMALMNAARPIDQIVDEKEVDDKIKEKLRYAMRARRFAVQELALPDNGSYTRYSDLKRSHVLWNVFATEELSLELKRWCFPVAGCIGYRGYYNKETAERFADKLAGQGMDVQVGGVPAYSTLGWFDDPLPSTVIRFQPAQIARLIFHELAHQVVYIKGDSTFNESFATAVEQVGVSRWLRARQAQTLDNTERVAYEIASRRKKDFLALLRQTRRRLDALYKSNKPDEEKRLGKADIFASLQTAYAQLKQDQWAGYSGYDRWFNRPLSNAHLASIGAYHDLVPAFAGLLRQTGNNLPAFYAQVAEIGKLTKDQRRERLNQYLADTQSVSGVAPQ